VCLTELLALVIVCLGLLGVFLWSLRDIAREAGYPDSLCDSGWIQDHPSSPPVPAPSMFDTIEQP
jgi:hypothetical protein